jgi:septal ring factor EnvC (AmiA/AmiB activator)
MSWSEWVTVSTIAGSVSAVGMWFKGVNDSRGDVATMIAELHTKVDAQHQDLAELKQDVKEIRADISSLNATAAVHEALIKR